MAVYRFGPFELDGFASELRRDGRRVRLRPQPCAALAHLVTRHGQFVSRAELFDALWRGTFVQFDDGLNSCIKQIRAALGDSRADPRYIETLTRRGYRFIAPVQVVAHVTPAEPAGPSRPAAQRRAGGEVVKRSVSAPHDAARVDRPMKDAHAWREPAGGQESWR